VSWNRFCRHEVKICVTVLCDHLQVYAEGMQPYKTSLSQYLWVCFFSILYLRRKQPQTDSRAAHLAVGPGSDRTVPCSAAQLRAAQRSLPPAQSGVCLHCTRTLAVGNRCTAGFYQELLDAACGAFMPREMQTSLTAHKQNSADISGEALRWVAVDH
jgi:hypothetical protein